jgi:hypothetical protein
MKLLLAESIDALDRIKRTAAKYLASQRSAVSHIWFSSCVLASSGFGGGAVTTGAGGGGAAQAVSPARTAQAARMRRLLEIGEVALFPKGRAGHMRILVLDSPNSAIRPILVRPMHLSDGPNGGGRRPPVAVFPTISAFVRLRNRAIKRALQWSGDRVDASPLRLLPPAAGEFPRRPPTGNFRGSLRFWPLAPGYPVGSYDFTWIWKELGLDDERR